MSLARGHVEFTVHSVFTSSSSAAVPENRARSTGRKNGVSPNDIRGIFEGTLIQGDTLGYSDLLSFECRDVLSEPTVHKRDFEPGGMYYPR